jgi:GT2 family glycosyltransferase
MTLTQETPPGPDPTGRTPAEPPAERALVDVLLPAFNAEATIAEAVESLLAQSVSRLRILAIDDGSTDATPDILATLAQRDSRVVLIRRPNGGIIEALNCGLSVVTAPFVARQDADDISFPDRIERQLAAFEAEPDLVAVSGSCIHIDASGHPTGSRYAPPDPDAADALALPASEPYLLHPFLMVRTDAFMSVAGYRHVLHSEDTDLYWRLREIGRLRNLSVALGQMRLHAGSISNASLQNGRIMAVHSQLAALSARRRGLARQDLAFSPDTRSAFRSAPSLEAMIGIAAHALDATEAAHLRRAAAVKLLELASGRLYELDRTDCAFVREVYASLSPDETAGRSLANWAYRASVGRLLRRGRLAELFSLLSLRVFYGALWRRLTGARREAGPRGGIGGALTGVRIASSPAHGEPV